jgi:hypothetical protein
LPKYSLRPESEIHHGGIKEHASRLNTGLLSAERLRGLGETVALEFRLRSQQLGALPLLISSPPSFNEALLAPDSKLRFRDEALHVRDETLHAADEAFHLGVCMLSGGF